MTTTQEFREAEAIAAEIRPHYREVRVLDDGSVAALGDLMFTRAIFLGCDRLGHSRRFCFEDRKLADKRFSELQSEDDVPEGFIARRGR